MSTHRACRIVLMLTSWPCPPIIQACRILLMPTSWPCPDHPSSMPQFAHANLTVMPARQRCRILLIPILHGNGHSSSMSHFAHARSMAMSILLVRGVAFCSCPPRGNVCSLSMSHYAHAHLTAMSACQRCRILLMPTSQSCPFFDHVAYISCPPHGLLTAMCTHRACRILLMPTSRPCLLV